MAVINLNDEEFTDSMEQEYRAFRVVVGIGGGKLGPHGCAVKVYNRLSDSNEKNIENLITSMFDIWYIIENCQAIQNFEDKMVMKSTEFKFIPFYSTILFCILNRIIKLRVKVDKIKFKNLYKEIKKYVKTLEENKPIYLEENRSGMDKEVNTRIDGPGEAIIISAIHGLVLCLIMLQKMIYDDEFSKSSDAAEYFDKFINHKYINLCFKLLHEFDECNKEEFNNFYFELMDYFQHKQKIKYEKDIQLFKSLVSTNQKTVVRNFPVKFIFILILFIVSIISIISLWIIRSYNA